MNRDTIGYAAALSAAVQTGLLSRLLERGDTPAGHAAALGLDARATERVLDVLVAFGWVTREGETVRMTPQIATELAQSPGGAAQAIALWQHVPQFLKTGAPLVKMDGEREQAYSNVVAALGRMFAPDAARLADRLARAPQRVLDIGCGSGVWSLALAQKYPAAHVTGLDLPAVLEAFRARAADLGVADRIATIPGDVHALDIPRAFDLVVIANVLRIESPERAKAIVDRAASAIVPGGQLLVVDALAGGTPEREQGRTVYGLHLAMRTDHGRVYTPAEVTAWMHGAGLRDVTPIDFASAQSGGLGALLGS